MAKYINADEFVTNLDTIGYPVGEFATDDYIDGFSDGVSAVMKEVKETPSADVVEVVRCKDCEYCEDYEGCDMAKNCNAWEHSVLPNWYCSYGKRREFSNGEIH